MRRSRSIRCRPAPPRERSGSRRRPGRSVNDAAAAGDIRPHSRRRIRVEGLASASRRRTSSSRRGSPVRACDAVPDGSGADQPVPLVDRARHDEPVPRARQLPPGVHDPIFWRALENSGFYMVVTVPGQIVLGLGDAVLLARTSADAGCSASSITCRWSRVGLSSRCSSSTCS